jgi:hypothetical protein
MVERREAALTTMYRVVSHKLLGAVRHWVGIVEATQLMRRALSALMCRQIRQGLNQWRYGGVEYARKLGVIKGTLWSLAGGHRTRKAINSWKDALRRHRLGLRGAASLFRQREAKAWRKWIYNIVKGAEVKKRLVSMLLVRQRKALNTWAEGHNHNRFVLRSVAHWRLRSVARAYVKWAATAENMAMIGFALKHLVNASVVRALNGWRALMAEAAVMRAAVAGWQNSAARRCLNAWFEFLEAREIARERMRAALATMGAVEVKHALLRWRQEGQALAPLKAGLARWRNRPLTKAFFKMIVFGRKMRRARALMAAGRTSCSTRGCARGSTSRRRGCGGGACSPPS